MDSNISLSDKFRANPIFKHLLYLLLFLIVLLVLVYFWLKAYTNHGQKIEMVNLIGKNLSQASKAVDENDFQLIVIDSTFIVGKPGGIILDQNPKPKSEVKEGRKVYITITKYDADKMLVSDLPLLYGNDFSQKVSELQLRGIKAVIKGKKYDPGDPNHILEVYYKNQLIIDNTTIRGDMKINKGDELEFIVSDKEGGEITVPDLTCKSMEEVEFLLQQSLLEVGEVTEKGAIPDRLTAYILDQDPKSDGSTKIPMNSKINLTIVSYKPARCN